jgi:hypothetical protein
VAEDQVVRSEMQSADYLLTPASKRNVLYLCKYC